MSFGILYITHICTFGIKVPIKRNSRIAFYSYYTFQLLCFPDTRYVYWWFVFFHMIRLLCLWRLIAVNKKYFASACDVIHDDDVTSIAVLLIFRSIERLLVFGKWRSSRDVRKPEMGTPSKLRYVFGVNSEAGIGRTPNHICWGKRIFVLFIIPIFVQICKLIYAIFGIALPS